LPLGYAPCYDGPVFESLQIKFPKQETNNRFGRAALYPYYPGFSPQFAKSLIKSTGLPRGATVLDPWNGSGTTTWSASVLGYRALGFDLNPAMVIVAKARSLCRREATSLWPLTSEVVEKAAKQRSVTVTESDPLNTWLVPRATEFFRRLECAIQMLLVDHAHYEHLAKCKNLNEVSDLASFFYTALFRTARDILKPFFTSNPTWIKVPRSHRLRLRPPGRSIGSIFTNHVRSMVKIISSTPPNSEDSSGETRIALTSSCSLPLEQCSVDLVLASPPYCTRIDYAVATAPELAILGYRGWDNGLTLRRSLIGSTTVPSVAPELSPEWGKTCIEFLSEVRRHRSKASATYYFKAHAQYFDGISRSISELSRVLKNGGICLLVAQDSYYKDVYNNLPGIIAEMADIQHLRLGRREEFILTRTMAGVNPAVRRYRRASNACETVLCFTKR